MTLAICLGIIGAFLSRWHGGGFPPKSPKVLKNVLWSIPFAVTTFFYLPSILWVQILVPAVVLGCCIATKATGHGGGMDLGHSKQEPGAGRSKEALEFLVFWSFDDLRRYWYDAFLLLVIGAASTLAPALAIGYFNFWHGVFILLGGMLGKPVAYMIGWLLYDRGLLKKFPKALNEGTAIGEFLTGFFAYFPLGIK